MEVCILSHLKYIALGLFLWTNFFWMNMAVADHPNIVYILADDQGYGEARSFNPDLPIATPGIDRIANEGMRFTDAHSGAANCTPTRYGLLTGRYSWRTRLQSGVLKSGTDPLIAENMLTVPVLLKKHGYRTAIVGKWHLGFHYEMPAGNRMDDAARVARTVPVESRVIEGPITRGFDTYHGYHNGGEIRTWIENDRVVEHLESYEEMLPRIRETSVNYLRERGKEKDGPFFLYVSLSSPHTPIAPGSEWQGRSGLGDYADFVMQTDDVVRQILDSLDEAGLAENTLVFFTTDNGTSRPAPVAELRRQGYDPTYGLRGRKSDAWEGGHRVPFVVRWPGVIKPGSTSDDTIVHNNLLATVADILKVEVPDDAGADSFSILPLLQGRINGEPTHPYVIHHSTKGCFAIRQGKWKLVACQGSGGYSKGDDGQPAQLYDLEADPYEQVNLIRTEPKQAGYLADLLELAVANGRSNPGSRLANDVPVDIWKTKIGRPDVLKISNTD